MQKSKKTLASSSSMVLDGMMHLMAYKLVQISYKILIKKDSVPLSETHDVFDATCALMREINKRNGALMDILKKS